MLKKNCFIGLFSNFKKQLFPQFNDILGHNLVKVYIILCFPLQNFNRIIALIEVFKPQWDCNLQNFYHFNPVKRTGPLFKKTRLQHYQVCIVHCLFPSQASTVYKQTKRKLEMVWGFQVWPQFMHIFISEVLILGCVRKVLSLFV